jgi:hypothetical protein
MSIFTLSHVKTAFADAMPIIERVSPALATVIGGPGGAALGYVLPLLAHAFGTHPTDIKGLIAAMANDPDVETKINGIATENKDMLEALATNTDRLTSAKINIELGWANPVS